LKAAKCNSRSEVQEKPTKIGTQTKAEKAKRRRVQKKTEKKGKNRENREDAADWSG